jgi:dTDP-4-dehydrorhamnose reductase
MQDFRHRLPEPQRLLVTGVDGTIGANLALSLAGRFAVFGLFQRHPVSLPGCRTAAWESAGTARWDALIRLERPHWIIHCGALASSSWDVPDECPDADHETRTCSLLAKLAAELGSRLTVISSDAVFAGPRLFHDETAPAANPHPFAQAVRGAEDALEAADALVVRTHAYGWSPAGAPPGFAERVWQTLIKQGPVRFDPDRHATPILASCLAEYLDLAYRRGLQGRYHVAGAERISAYRFAIELATAFGLSGWGASADGDPLEHGEPDHLHETSLSTRRAQRALGRPMPMLRDGLERFARQATDGFRARLQCGTPHLVEEAA